MCKNSNQIISLRRVKDGYYDCLFRDDEINDLQPITALYRYRCLLPYPTQYVGYQHLGNQINECADGSDEVSSELDWTFFRCEYEDDYGCWMLRNNRANDVQVLFHHHCDSIWNTMDGKDERNCSSWMCAIGMYHCKGTGQCIDKAWRCDGEYDCNNGEDELNCSQSKLQWTMENKCDEISEFFCVTSSFLSNVVDNRPCIDRLKVGNGILDCVGGRDEKNVLPCSDHRMLGDRFSCDNETKCLAHGRICDGFFDCHDHTDELICSWSRHHCRTGQFACSDGQTCLDHRCNLNQSCPSNEHLFWCPDLRNGSGLYRSNKTQRQSEYNSFCNSYPSKVFSSEISAPVIAVRSKVQLTTRVFCNRGFFFLTRNGTNSMCFCPPSYYGDRCQFNRRRISVIVRVDRRYRSDVPPVLYVLVSLICNHTIVVDHQTFVDVSKDFPDKHHVYLLYSRPRLECLYSVRFEAYHNINLLFSWQYLISPLDFLPVFRLAKILHFPNRALPWLCPENLCLNNGACYVQNGNVDHYLCICLRGWKGIHCEKQSDQNDCSPKALVREQNICVCPYEQLLPHCYVQNNICKRSSPCLPHQTCYALSSLPPDQYVCLCQSSKCREYESFLVLHQSQSNDQPFLIQLLKLSSNYPRIRQQLIIEASSRFPVKRSIITHDKRKKMDGVLPEIGLLYKFTPQVDFVEIILNILYINCSKELFDLTLNLDTQLQQCYPLSSDTHSLSVEHYHTYCRVPRSYSCFYSTNYVCYCSSLTNRSECISHSQYSIPCSHCINQGICIQGDLQNKSDFACVCPKCATGSLCQFSFKRFSISFEMLIEKTHRSFRSLISPTIFLFISTILNGLSLSAFIKQKVRTTNIGLHLFLNAIISQLAIILLFTRVLYLTVARELTIAFSVHSILCKVLPYLMSSLNYISLWLMAFVAVERVIMVAVPMKFRLLRTVRSAAIVFIVTCFIIFGTLYKHIRQYKLIIHPDDSHPWCIQEILTLDRQFVQYTSLAHQIIPFVVNLFAGMTIIVVVNRSRALSHHLSPRKTIVSELRHRFELLIAPAICFVTQLPQLVILFLDTCDYEKSTWFVNATLIAYYISFTPQMSVLFIYILPSPLYKEVLLIETKFGKYLNEIFRISHLPTNNNRPH